MGSTKKLSSIIKLKAFSNGEHFNMIVCFYSIKNELLQYSKTSFRVVISMITLYKKMPSETNCPFLVAIPMICNIIFVLWVLFDQVTVKKDIVPTLQLLFILSIY